MKKLSLIIFFLSAIFIGNAQSVALTNQGISPAPLNLVENNGTGVGSFTFVESLNIDVPATVFGLPNVTISVVLQYVELTNFDVTLITGTLLNHFSVSYDQVTNRILFSQNSIIPGDWFGSIDMPLTVIQNSTSAQSFNGFNANIAALDVNTNAEGSAAVFTYTTNLPIVAVNDTIGGVDGTAGQIGVVNVFDNDTLNGSPVNPADVTLTELTPDPTGNLTLNPDGSVDVAPGTPAGTYTIEYQICDILNPTNCDTAIVSITVGNTLIDAVLDDFTANPVNGLDGGVVPNSNVYDNDTLNGAPVNPADVTLTSTPTGPLTVNTDGTVTVAPNTPAGTYTIDYTICENLNPANCDTDTVTVVVDPAPIVAVNDTIGGVDGSTGQIGVVNVFDNDTLNGAPVNPADVTLTELTPDPTGNLTLNPDGSVDVAPGTPAGTYTIEYQICEILNPTNCDTAIVSITVGNTLIDAVLDDFTANPVNGLDGGVVPNSNVYDNDTLNGAPVNPADVTLTSTPTGPLTVNTDGTVTVAPNTPAGTYTIDYTICENLNPANCDTDTVTVVVGPAPIVAVNDTIGGVDGTTGQIGVVNVFGNDTLNGAPVNPADVTLTELTPDPTGNLTLNPDGSVDVAPGTPAGTYTIEYQICEILNPTNCDTAIVSITVGNTLIDAVLDDFTANPVNGLDGGVVPNSNVYDNDTLNGAPVNPADVTLTSTPTGPLTVNTDGTVTVAPNTPAGTYTIDYTICENLNPANCDTDTVTVVVDPAPIVAVNDTIGGVDGTTGQIGVVNVFGNDTLNGAPVNPADVTLTELTPDPTGNLTLNPDGSVDVAPGTPAGTYTIEYQICEILNPTNCDTAIVSITVGNCLSIPTNDCDGDGVTNEDELNPPDGELPTDPSNPCDFIPSDIILPQMGEFLGADCDGDGNPNIFDSEPFNPCVGGDVDNVDLTDTTSDWALADCDGDGVINITEVDPDGNGTSGPNGTDINEPCDFNAIDISEVQSGTWNDEDCDNDGIPNGIEVGANPLIPVDTDGDLILDIFDIDDDNDGILTLNESQGDTDTNGLVDYLDQDSDNDGIPDNVEAQPTDNYVVPTGIDDDGDGLDNAYDGLNSTGLDPVNTDDDLEPDYVDEDSDNDGVDDAIEAFDTDSDGEPNIVPSENDDNNNGIDDAFEDGAVGYEDPNGSLNNGASDTVNTDENAIAPNESDAEVDFRDEDDDGDKIPTGEDEINADCDNDNKPDYLDPDSCTLIPQGFTPDNDGQNDTFVIPAVMNYPNFEIEIYDRWGNIVYEYQNNGREVTAIEWWDAFSNGRWTLNEGSKIVPVGTYFYVINFNKDNKAPIDGWVYVNY